MVKNFDDVQLPVVRVPVALRPCPFCGGIAELCLVGENIDGFGMNAYSVACTSCCSVGKPFDNSQDAVAFWNTRKGV